MDKKNQKWRPGTFGYSVSSCQIWLLLVENPLRELSDPACLDLDQHNVYIINVWYSLFHGRKEDRKYLRWGAAREAVFAFATVGAFFPSFVQVKTQV